jgi:hypothetical protein
MTMATEPMTTDPMIAALLREREGYARAQQPDRVAQVDEQLRTRGYDPDPDGDEKPKGERSTGDRAPKGRQAPPKRTA